MKPDLAQLHDIHLPSSVAWWPPAPGWWLLAVLLLIASAGGYRWWRRQHRDRWRQQTLAELDKAQGLTGSDLAATLSQLLRRVALNRYPQAEVAALSGEAWLAFLDRSFGAEQPFSQGVGRVLLVAPYSATCEFDGASLHALCAEWIRKQPGGRR